MNKKEMMHYLKLTFLMRDNKKLKESIKKFLLK